MNNFQCVALLEKRGDNKYAVLNLSVTIAAPSKPDAREALMALIPVEAPDYVLTGTYIMRIPAPPA